MRPRGSITVSILVSTKLKSVILEVKITKSNIQAFSSTRDSWKIRLKPLRNSTMSAKMLAIGGRLQALLIDWYRC